MPTHRTLGGYYPLLRGFYVLVLHVTLKFLSDIIECLEGVCKGLVDDVAKMYKDKILCITCFLQHDTDGSKMRGYELARKMYVVV